MAIYKAGELVKPDVSDVTKPAVNASKKRPFETTHGRFSKHRTGWTETDVDILQRLANGERSGRVATHLQMTDRYFWLILAVLRKIKKARTNIELVAIALREGVIK